ncbi:hypothetical protein [Pseudomonas aeruginosa]|uniref:hypothetical protein n=1 Tax=Pseudomonas aeruginosa TaxID=287 RepID=UPI001CD5791A|nr:hypothetical protein [Pseudomonas aeruginosa]
MREEFEAWHHAEFGYVIAVEDDPQQDGQCAKRWKAWQASRAALRVELPKSDYADQLDGDAYVMESRAVAKALQQAGIEVAK